MLVGPRELKEGGVLSGVGPLEDPVALFLVQAVIIISMCRLLSLLGMYLRQPSVIFEVIGGIILGPSGFGRNSDYMNKIFPSSSLRYLDLVASIGLILYLFLIGLELDPKLILSTGKSAILIAIMGIALPFALGVSISSTLINKLQYDMNTDYKSFCVFIGTAMSITAFPVLARILKEGNLILTKPGAITMSAAAVDDAVAWCLLTLAISMSNAGNDAVAGYNFMCVTTFAIGLITVVRVILEKIVIYVEAFNTPLMDGNLFAFILICVFLCSWTTSNLGVHFIFGAFLFGLIVPRESRIFHECTESIEKLILTFTLPLYFAFSGLKTDITQADAGMTILVIVIASVSKFIGCGFTSYFVAKMDWRESCVIAVLMNTRGLIELIVLNIGLKSKILNTRTFSTMVIMCLFTTLVTNPLVEFLLPVSIRDQYLVESEKNDTTEISKNNTDTPEVMASTSPLGHRISVC